MGFALRKRDIHIAHVAKYSSALEFTYSELSLITSLGQLRITPVGSQVLMPVSVSLPDHKRGGTH